MKKIRIAGLLFAVLALALSAGCAKNEIDSAIELLGGTDAERQEAQDIIAMSVNDPLPRLMTAMENSKLSSKTRKYVALEIGTTCERMGEAGMEESPVPVMMKVIGGADEEVKDAIVEALGRIPGKDSLKALQDLLDNEDEKVAQKSWDILDARAREFEARANELANTALERKAELFAEAVAINPRNVELAQKLAAFYEVLGEADKAREVYNMGGEFVSAVKVIGPFPGNLKEAPFDPASFDTSKPVSVKGETLQWFDFTDVPGNGAVDFRKSPKTKISKSIFFAAFDIDSGAAQNVLMKVACPRSQFEVWVNGQNVLESGPSSDEQEIPLSLISGTNKVLVKLRSKKYARFSIRVSGTNHMKLDNVEYSM